MTDKASETDKDVEAGRRALSRWENEGGADAQGSQLSTSVGDAETDGLKLTNVEVKERLRQALIDQAQTGNPTAYKDLADRLGLEPPQTIHRIGDALEALMEDDVAACRPMLAALCVSKMRPGIPSHGFFLRAQVLGVFSGDPTGSEARAFHAIELQRVLSFYGSQRPHLVPVAL